MSTHGADKPNQGPYASVPIAALAIACLGALHWAIVADHTRIALLILACPLVLVLVRGWPARLLAAGGVLLLNGMLPDAGQTLLRLVPFTINAALALVFVQSLRPGKTPLITRYSILIRGGLEPAVVGYTRKVTVLWALFFTAMAGESLLLALFAPLEIWSLFTNLLNYAFTALVFIGEYAFRVRHLNGLDHPGFLQFLTSIARLNVRDLQKR